MTVDEGFRFRTVWRLILSVCREDLECHSFGSVRLHRCSNVRINISGDAFAGVVEPVLYDLHWHSGFKCHCGPAVTKRVEADLR